jgi:hypothetical protein
MYEKLADFSKEAPPEVDVYKLIDEQVKSEVKDK